MSGTIRLAFSTDRRFVHRTAIALRSILVHASRPVEAIILYSGLSESDRDDLVSSCRPYDAAVRFVAIDTERLRDLPVLWQRMSHAAYFRLLLPQLMPTTDKVLYLDSDIICCGDIAPLWNTDVSAHAAGCVREPRIGPRNFWRKLVPSRAQIDSMGRANYFNSGVLLINLHKWRDERIAERAFEWRRKNARAKTHDQDALNAVIGGDWLQLSARWNFNSGFLRFTNFRLERHQRRLDPVLLHLSAMIVPAPARRLSLHYLSQTPWAGRANLETWNEPTVEKAIRKFKWMLRKLHIVCFPFLYGPPTEYGRR